ncbi:unnamed protein product [Ixodes pacificus]
MVRMSCSSRCPLNVHSLAMPQNHLYQLIYQHAPSESSSTRSGNHRSGTCLSLPHSFLTIAHNRSAEGSGKRLRQMRSLTMLQTPFIRFRSSWQLHGGDALFLKVPPHCPSFAASQNDSEEQVSQSGPSESSSV